MDLKNEKNIDSFQIIEELWKIISLKRKYQLSFLLLLMFLSGLGESFTIGAIVPLLKLFDNNGQFPNLTFLKNLNENFYTTYLNHPLIFIVFLFIFILSCSVIIRILNLFFSSYISGLIGNDLSTIAFKKTIYKSYLEISEMNSNSLINAITSQVKITINGIYGILLLISSSIIVSGIFISMLIYNAKITYILFFSFIFIYVLLFQYLKKKLYLNGSNVAKIAKNQIQLIREILGALDVITLNNFRNKSVAKYYEMDLKMRFSMAQSIFFAAFPRYLIESLALIIFAIIGLGISKSSGSSDSIEILGFFAFAAQRSLPAIQQIYGSAASFSYQKKGIKELLSQVHQNSSEIKIYNFENKRWNYKSNRSDFHFDSLIIKNLSFNYPKQKESCLTDINLEILKGDKIALVGKSGAGKSTLLKLLLTFIKPTKGFFLLNDIDLYKNENIDLLLNFRDVISYVPQKIYLFNDSIKNNIALNSKSFGVEKQIIKAAKIAGIHETIKKLPYGYDTIVGEEGALLSGGQRQRIAVARSIYKKSQIIILDEPTSSIDSITEDLILNDIFTYFKNKVIIIVAHNNKIKTMCNKIFTLKDGSLFSQD